MLNDIARQSLAALRILLTFTVILGVAYPVTVWAAGQAFGDRADGQPITIDGQVVGSRLLGQNFHGEEWFHSRPSANDYDTLASAPSNLGPSNTDLLALIKERRTSIAQTESVEEDQVPPDAVTASGSGLDPHISPEYAAIQAPRVAEANSLDLDRIEQLIDENTDGRTLGFLGEPGVNVLELNLAVQDAARDA
ncbi:K+-transporting ATPase ATPase C chain [Nocardioides daedukensis]|uniref:Potassium-transporting ATPase KdpC subunit n=1 Tax=Nocardioides daedukensis TaxID=634462 RepID=A0A7Y9S034_9ACTN|nr:potassium-transporting ATPase subunit KdpC [Nocardioides daedukensis]NYG57279.1 K+-transporting ATPase ATPase C chain [Nocardioides daedukensis]